MIQKHTKNEFLVPWTTHGVPWEVQAGCEEIDFFDYVNRKRLSDSPVDWKENKPFKAGLELKRFVGSTDSTQVIVQHTETGQFFYMRDQDFLQALKKSACTFGVLLGEWKFKKTVGRYYGLVLV